MGAASLFDIPLDDLDTSRLVLGDAVLDMHRGLFRYGQGDSVHLPTEEARLAEILFLNHGHCVSTCWLMRHIRLTNQSQVGLFETIASRLKQKLDTAFGREVLAAVEGKGWKVTLYAA